jgi:hypothetical protein
MSSISYDLTKRFPQPLQVDTSVIFIWDGRMRLWMIKWFFPRIVKSEASSKEICT